MTLDTALLLASIVAQTCDLTSTNVALSRGFSEGNPVLAGSRLKLNTLKVSFNVGAFVLWHKNRHKKASRAIPIALTASGSVACGLNIKTLRK